jgi:transposase-like protein
MIRRIAGHGDLTDPANAGNRRVQPASSYTTPRDTIMGIEIWTVVHPITSPSTPAPTSRWHFDEMAVMIAGTQFWLWRVVDDEGEVLDLLVQRRN